MGEEFYYNKLLEYAKTYSNSKLAKRGKAKRDDVPRKYAFYVRKSTPPKSKNKLKKNGNVWEESSEEKQKNSIQQQIDACNSTIKQGKLQVIGTPIIEKKSAKFAGKRELFSKMLMDIRRGKYNAIVAWHPDRLARNMKEAGEIIDMIDNGLILDLKFASYTFTNDSSGLLTLGLQFVLAKQYSDSLSNSVKRGMSFIVQKGKATTSRTKPGYLLDDYQNYIPDGDNFKLLQEAWHMALKRNSFEVICKYLNKNGFEYEGKKGTMDKGKLSERFKDCFYAGVLVFGEEIVDIKEMYPEFEPMVTPQEFIRLRSMLDSKATAFVTAREKEPLFRNIVYCAFCGKLMTPNKPKSREGKRFMRLKCLDKSCARNKIPKPRKKGDPTKELRGYVLTDFVADFIDNELKIDKKLYKNYTESAQLNFNKRIQESRTQRQRFKRQLTEYESLKTQNEKLCITFHDDEELLKEYKGKVEECNKHISETKEKIEMIENNLSRSEIDFKNTVPSFTEFSNQLKFLSTKVRLSTNQYLVDKIIKLIFSNLHVDLEGVAIFKLNPPFEMYNKMGAVLNGDACGTRTCDRLLKRQLLYQLS